MLALNWERIGRGEKAVVIRDNELLLVVLVLIAHALTLEDAHRTSLMLGPCDGCPDRRVLWLWVWLVWLGDRDVDPIIPG